MDGWQTLGCPFHRLLSTLRLANRTLTNRVWSQLTITHLVCPQMETVMFRHLKVWDFVQKYPDGLVCIHYSFLVFIFYWAKVLYREIEIEIEIDIYIYISLSPTTSDLSVLPWVTTIPIPVYLLCSTDLYSICLFVYQYYDACAAFWRKMAAVQHPVGCNTEVYDDRHKITVNSLNSSSSFCCFFRLYF